MESKDCYIEMFTYLQITQPIQALSGTVAPWFGQIGGGTQYLLLDGRVDQLLADGLVVKHLMVALLLQLKKM